MVKAVEFGDAVVVLEAEVGALVVEALLGLVVPFGPTGAPVVVFGATVVLVFGALVVLPLVIEVEFGGAAVVMFVGALVFTMTLVGATVVLELAFGLFVVVTGAAVVVSGAPVVGATVVVDDGAAVEVEGA